MVDRASSLLSVIFGRIYPMFRYTETNNVNNNAVFQTLISIAASVEVAATPLLDDIGHDLYAEDFAFCCHASVGISSCPICSYRNRLAWLNDSKCECLVGLLRPSA